MRVTHESLQQYIGGQVEIQNLNEGYLYRGEIETIIPAEGVLRVRFTWIAKMDFVQNSWVKEDRLDWSASTEIGADFVDIGGGRLLLRLIFVGETSVFFPPGDSRLDPKHVKGLEIAEEATS